MYPEIGKRMFLKMRIKMITVIAIQATLRPHPYHPVTILSQTQNSRGSRNRDILEAVLHPSGSQKEK
jgi:hypothetical protein